MLRRKVIKRLLLLGGSITALGGSAITWKYVQLTKALNWDVFTSHHDLLAELTETILPATNTPGAKAVGVPAYVQHMVKSSLDVKTQHNFISGLEEVSEYCRSTFNKSFAQCTGSEKDEVLSYFEKKGLSSNALVGKVRTRLIGKPFYNVLRDLTIIGYCTSEVGTTQTLAYDYIPGAFQGCLPYQKGQKSWATQ